LYLFLTEPQNETVYGSRNACPGFDEKQVAAPYPELDCYFTVQDGASRHTKNNNPALPGAAGSFSKKN
jgi:hypothetical protein